METTITIDGAGRMVLPKKVREELNLEAGDTLELVSDSGQVTLRPVRAGNRMKKDRGIWVFSGGGTIRAEETDQVLNEVRRGGRSE